MYPGIQLCAMNASHVWYWAFLLTVCLRVRQPKGKQKIASLMQHNVSQSFRNYRVCKTWRLCSKNNFSKSLEAQNLILRLWWPMGSKTGYCVMCLQRSYEERANRMGINSCCRQIRARLDTYISSIEFNRATVIKGYKRFKPHTAWMDFRWLKELMIPGMRLKDALTWRQINLWWETFHRCQYQGFLVTLWHLKSYMTEKPDKSK